jgi:hypothetical protein
MEVKNLNIRMDTRSKKGIGLIIAYLPIGFCFFILDRRLGNCASYGFLAVSHTLWFAIILWWGRGIWKERMDESPVLGAAFLVMFIIYLLVIGYIAISECNL